MSENLKFTYLKAVGIVLVVLAHAGGGGGVVSLFFEYWFPPYSFHLPLFVFASGYFYREALSASKYLWKRFRRLIVPFYGWNLFYGMLVTVLLFLGATNIGNTITLQNFFIDPWIKGDSGYELNFVAWFAIWLFTVQAVYTIIRKALKIKNEYILLTGCFVVGVFGTYLSVVGFDSQPLAAQFIKLLFGLPLLQLGYVYRVKLEKHDKPSIKSFVAVLVIQAILIIVYKSQYPFTFLVRSGDFNDIFLPFLTSLTGIWLWLQICTLLSNKLGNNRIVSWLGHHTWEIMIHHIFGLWLLNTFFLAINAPGFDIAQYRTNIFYEYYVNGDYHFLIFYALAGILVPLAIFKLTSALKREMRKLSFVKDVQVKLEAIQGKATRTVS